MATCKGRTKDRQSCKNPTKEGEDYCWVHKRQSELQEGDNIAENVPIQTEELSISRRDLVSPGGAGKLLRWLRKTLTPEAITQGVVVNTIYELLKAATSEAGKALSELNKLEKEIKQSESPLAIPSPNESRPQPKEVPTPPTTPIAANTTSTPIPEGQFESIQKGENKDLSFADLRKADLREANLIRADLRKANLNGADLYRANLYRANLARADLREANLNGANLNGADLRFANLIGANLARADLRKACLTFARLHKANLNGANLIGADLEGANLEGANLSFANLSFADLNGANLIGAFYTKSMKWPEGFDPEIAGLVCILKPNEEGIE